MTMYAGVPVLAAEGAGLIDRWRDLGPILWLAAGVLALVWLALFGLATAMVDPRRVRPGPATLEVQGTESPAVVNLVTSDWDLGHEAIPATLIDLAARRYIEIDLVGGRTFVRMRANRAGRPGEAALEPYEEMVLAHVRRLAGQTADGRVPSEALTTGPDATAKRWWKDFHHAVVRDARRRDLSQARWSPALKTTLIAAGLPVGFAVALAMSTLLPEADDGGATGATDTTTTSPTTVADAAGTAGPTTTTAPPGSCTGCAEDTDDDTAGYIYMAIMTGFGAWCLLGALVTNRSGERDTPEGREVAARWLGLRELLAEDPLFAEQPPAAVAIWDHLLAQGTALGVAHGVVAALPLGAESEREAWSSVGGRWRVVRVRYPRRIPPGYGRHPGIVTLLGLVQVAVAVPILARGPAVATALRELLDRGAVNGIDFENDLGTEIPTGVEVGIGIVLAVFLVVACALFARGALMTLLGLADLVQGRQEIEGRVLRRRVRVKTNDSSTRYVVHLAVDDGHADRVRAWRFAKLVDGEPGQTVSARVTRRLRHVADLAVVGRASDPAATTGEVAAAAAAVEATLPPSPGAPAPSAVPAMAVAPPLPGDAAVSAAAGRPLTRDPGAAPHPAALTDGSAIYRFGPDGHVQVAWVPTATIDVYRRVPSVLRHELPGLGDEGYRARFGGGVLARTAEHVLMVTPHLPGVPSQERDAVAERVAAAVLAGARGDAPRRDSNPSAGSPLER